MPNTEWCVYEDASGITWGVSPATEETAAEEAKLLGVGHRPMPTRIAEQLQNAFAHGRLYGHRQCEKTHPASSTLNEGTPNA